MISDEIFACSWSGGKDSCLACYRAIKQGYKVRYLLNFISKEFKRVRFHGAKDGLLKLQAQATGIELFQRETTKDGYEKEFIEAIRNLKHKGIEGLICGDIHLADCRQWVENVCRKEGIVAVKPLWGFKPIDLINEFIDLGFETVITSTQAELLGKEWIGRKIDKKFVKDLQNKGDVDICGENGEFHTFVINGPIFKKRVKILKTDVVLKNGYWFLDIQKYQLKEKEEVMKI